MPHNEELADRIRMLLKRRKGVLEKNMFGGVAFMISGHMSCGVTNNDLMVRVGKDAYDAALKLPGARPMDFTGRPLKGFVYVGKRGHNKDADLRAWVERGIKHARSLPPK